MPENLGQLQVRVRVATGISWNRANVESQLNSQESPTWQTMEFLDLA